MVICVVNQKGGVGKTTTTLNLGAALAETGRSVLLVDLDTQHDLSVFSDSLAASGWPLRLVTAEADTLATVLSGSIQGNQDDGSNRDAGGAGGADFTLLDCPPALGPEVAAALKVADVVLVPLQAEFLAMRGLKRLQETVAFVSDPRRQGNPNLQLRIVLTMTDTRDPISSQVAEDVARRFPDTVLPVVIKRSPLFASSSLARESILQHSPRSHGAAAFRALAAEFLHGTLSARENSTLESKARGRGSAKSKAQKEKPRARKSAARRSEGTDTDKEAPK